MTASALQELHRRYAGALDEALRRELTGTSAGEEFNGMLLYPFGYVDDQLRPVRSPGGKRFRPALCLLACESTGGDWQEALRAAAAIEMLHNFSLVHDDIEDGDEMRRHREAVWAIWGEAHGINIGDAIFALAVRSMQRAHPDAGICLHLAREFAATTVTLTEGQYLDMRFEERLDVTPAMYLDMIRRKSAALIAYSLWSGAHMARASDTTCEALREFGMHMGQAFQIHDDIMGIWGDPEHTGKIAAMDVRKRKKTLPVLLAFQGVTGEDRAAMDAYYSGHADDESLVIGILKRTQAESLAQRERDKHLSDGLNALDRASLHRPERELFAQLASEITGQPVPSS